ncbi:MAG: two-component regulator propeller domain-containing protein [Mangrovibacterium sp.]
MRVYFYFLFFISLNLFSTFDIFAHVSTDGAMQISFQKISTSEGLPQNTVDCMLKDSRGFMWFGTWNGLCRYDGYSFDVFQKKDFPLLSGNRTQSLAEDTLGNIWVGTESGIALFDYGRFEFVSVDALQQVSIADIAIDGAGRVWVATIGKGVWRIDTAADGGFDATKFLPGEIDLSNVNDLFVDTKNIWIGSDGGLVVYSLDSGVLNVIYDDLRMRLGSVSVQKIFQDSQENVWIGSAFSGIFKYNLSNRSFVHYPASSDFDGDLSHRTVKDIIEDELGTVIVGTLGGLNYYDSKACVFKQLKDTESLGSPFVNSLLADESGNVWVGTDKSGVEYYNIHRKPFYSIASDFDKSSANARTPVNAILVEDDYLWLGTAGGGLSRFRDNQGTYFRKITNDSRSLSNNFVSVIHRDHEQNLWVGTWGGGLNRLAHINSGYFEHYTHNAGDENSLGYDFISCIDNLNDSELLIGTGLGIDIFNPQEKRFTPINESSGIRLELHVGCMLVDSKGFVWVGTEYGLYCFRVADLEQASSSCAPPYELFLNDSSDSCSIAGNYIISLFESSKGEIWIGTYGNGICRLDKKNGDVVFTNFTENEGLCNDVIYGIEEDHKGNLWVSTDNGLSCFNPQSKKVQNYTQHDGLVNNQFYWQSSFCDKNGYLYFGGINGLNYFDPAAINTSSTASRLSFTKFSIFGKEVEVGESYHSSVILSKPISDSPSINLSYKDAVFSIEFSALNYCLPEKIDYAYQMEGVDQDWVFVPSSRRFANYTNLSGGDYIFKVKSSNSDGIWSDDYISLQIHVIPPFWETFWFNSLVVIFLIGLGLFYIRFRTRRLQEQKEELEKLVQIRTFEIELQKNTLEKQNEQISHQHAELLALNEEVKRVNSQRLRFFTNISHEFRTPLTLIIGSLEQLLNKYKKEEKDMPLFEVMNRNAQRLLHLINQLLYFRKVENDGLKLQVIQGNMSLFIRRIYESFRELASQREIEFSYQVENDVTESWFDSEKIEHILYNLLSNAFKHTPMCGAISLQLNFHLHDISSPLASPSVEIKVTDNGKGISDEHLPKIFNRYYKLEENRIEDYNSTGIGLDLTAEMVEALHGKIKVESTLGKGSTFTVYLPYTSESYDPNELLSEHVPISLDLSENLKSLQLEISSEQHLLSQQAEIAVNDLSCTSEKPTVLLVEDNADLRFFLSELFIENYQIMEAVDGEMALTLTQQFSPDLIISDVMMPNLNGVELCKCLKGNLSTCHIPIILLTAKNMEEDYLIGLEAGADDYITKPFNLAILRAKIKNIIAARNQVKQLLSSPKPVLPQEVTKNKVDVEFIARAYRVLEDKLNSTDFSADQFALEMLVSKSLLYKKIKLLTNMSITDFINTYKLKKAAQLIQTSSLTMAEIAFQSGFNDPKYFSRIFKKFYEISPSDYQREYGHKSPL